MVNERRRHGLVCGDVEFTSKAADCPKPTDQAKRAIRGLFEAMRALEFGRLNPVQLDT